MFSLLRHIPFRESRIFIISCLMVFMALLSVWLAVPRPVKTERSIEKRKAEGKVVPSESYVPVWLYKGLQMNLLLTGAILLASPWLGRRRKGGMYFIQKPASTTWTRTQTVACVLLLGYVGWQNGPRLFHSMWGDEEFNASRFILDEVERQPDGTLKIEPRSWATTLWSMRKPTNHLGYSFAARLSHETFFQKSNDAGAPWFSEALLRAPVFLAGLLTPLLLVWSLRVWGLNGWWAALFLMVHPWFVRFGVDGRGYGFVMLGITALVGIAGKALQTGRWRWWMASGFVSFWILWSNLQSVYLIGALNLMMLAGLLDRDLTRAARWLLLSRWFVGNMLTALLTLGYLAPCWPQLTEFLAKGEILGEMDMVWWKDSISAWFFGQPWSPVLDETNPLRFGMTLTMERLPLLHVAGMILFLVLLMYGIFKLAGNRQHRALLILILGGPFLMILHAYIGKHRPYDWYLFPFLPGLTILMAGAFQGLAQWHKKASFIILTTALILFMVITHVPRHHLRAYPLEASRESVAAYRKITNLRNPDFDKEVISGGLLMYTEGYDPALYRIKDVTELQALMDQADRTGKKLYMNVGFMSFVRSSDEYGPTCRILEDDSKFEHLKSFPGLLPYTTREVYRYRGKSG
ncbi:MAG: hypothetical protein RL693_2250 [Verrucomicrobiota bacterium]|jgi:hypothetical protein